MKKRKKMSESDLHKVSLLVEAFDKKIELIAQEHKKDRERIEKLEQVLADIMKFLIEQVKRGEK